MLLGDVYLVWETHGFTRFLHGAGVNQETFYMVDYYQEFRYTVSSSGGLRSRSRES